MGCKESIANTMGAGRELGVMSESGGLWPAAEPLPWGKEAVVLGSVDCSFFFGDFFKKTLFYLMYVYMYVFLAALGLLAAYCLSLVVVSEGYSLVMVLGLLTAVASLVVEHRL